MKNTSLTMAEREREAGAGAPVRAERAREAPPASGPAMLDLDEIHYQALLRLGHDRRRYRTEE